MATFVQWLLLQSNVVRANTVSNETSSAQTKVKKTPRGTAKGTKTPKAPKKAATLDNNKQSVCDSTKAKKTPKRSSNKKAKVTEPAKAGKPTKKRRRSMLVDTDDSEFSYCTATMTALRISKQPAHPEKEHKGLSTCYSDQLAHLVTKKYGKICHSAM